TCRSSRCSCGPMGQWCGWSSSPARSTRQPPGLSTIRASKRRSLRPPRLPTAEDSRASVGAMTEQSRWAARRGRWKVERLDPALERAPERRGRFSTMGEIDLEPLYGPWSWEAGLDGASAGAGGPTEVDHHGDPLPRGRWDAFDPQR